MDCAYLRRSELRYEMLIRDIKDDLDFAASRAYLRNVIETNPDPVADALKKYETDTSFAARRSQVEGSLGSLQQVLGSFNGKDKETVKRFESRFVHIRQRIINMLGDSNIDWATLKSDWLDTADELYAKFIKKIDEAKQKVRKRSMATSTRIGPNLNASSAVNFGSDNVVSRVPICKWNVVFDGSQCLFEFLQRVDELSVARGVSKDSLFKSAIDLFSGEALTWFRSYRNKILDWDQLVEFLKRDFLPFDCEEKLWDEIRNRKQEKFERSHLFICRMENLFQRLPRKPSEEIRLKYIRRGLLPQFSTQLALHQIDSIEVLVEMCRRLEEVREHNPRKVKEVHASTIANVPPSPNARKQPGECWNCGVKGHAFAKCKRRRDGVFCYRCGRKGVKADSCNCRQSKN